MIWTKPRNRDQHDKYAKRQEKCDRASETRDNRRTLSGIWTSHRLMYDQMMEDRYVHKIGGG